MITDIGHTAFRAHNVERTLAFYAKLGIDEAFRLHREDGSLMLIYLHVGGDRFIEVFPGGEKTEQPGGNFMHLCLLTDDLRGDVEALQQQGVTLERDIKTGLDGNLQAWIRDPDGNDIELMQLSEDSPQRRISRGESVA